MIIEPDAKVVFFGDSITHWYGTEEVLGLGYCGMVGRALERVPKTTQVTAFNRGISGNKVADLKARVEDDVLSLKPNWVSMLVGINDVRGAAKMNTSLTDFEADYRYLMDLFQEKVGNIIIMSPFLCGGGSLGNKDLDDFKAKHQIVAQIADNYNCVYIDLDEAFRELTSKIDPKLLTKDGVHPTQMGAGFIADLWWKTVEGQEL